MKAIKNGQQITKPKATEPNKNDKRPIAKFYRCWLEDVSNGVALQKCRGINYEQYRAADMLTSNYERAFSRGGSGRGFIEIPAIKTHYYSSHAIDSQLEAMRQYQAVFDRLNRKSREIIEHFCLLEKPLRQYELCQVPQFCQVPQWVKGVGSARLREALDELIEVYRQIG